MFEKFFSEDSENFSQRYLNTFGFYCSKGKKVLVKLTQITKDTVTFVDKNSTEYYLNADVLDEDVGFEFIVPKNAYHNTSLGTILVSRIPAKQYSRGICHKNTLIQGVNGPLKVGFETLSLMYDTQESASKHIHNCLDGLSRSCALSSAFAILDYVTLFCFDSRIGTIININIENKEVEINLDNYDLWKTEVSDAFNRNNWKVGFNQ